MMVQTLPGRPWLQAAQCLCTLHFACSVECFSDTDVGKLGTELHPGLCPFLLQPEWCSAYHSTETTSRSLSYSSVLWPWSGWPGHFHLCHQEGRSWEGVRRARHGHRASRQRWTYVCLGAVKGGCGLSAWHSGMRHRPCGSRPGEHLGA